MPPRRSTGSSPRTPRQGTGAHDYADKSRGDRLQKVLADAGVAARRECETLVLEGAVSVNGEIVDTLPAWVDPATDRIEVYGKPLRKAEKHYYIVLFKPRGTVCTNSDPEGRPRAIDLVQHPSKPRLYCVGRLDLDSSGLLVLTNDGEFANRLTHPRYGVGKGYEVTVEGRLDEPTVAALERRIFGARSRAARESSIRLVKREKDRTLLEIELCEHRNLQVRPLLLELGHPVKKLRRISFGPLRLRGLGVGEWRELTSKEIAELRRASSGKGVTAAATPAKPRDPDVMAKRTARTLAREAEEARARAEEESVPSETRAKTAKGAPRGRSTERSSAPTGRTGSRRANAADTRKPSGARSDARAGKAPRAGGRGASGRGPSKGAAKNPRQGPRGSARRSGGSKR